MTTTASTARGDGPATATRRPRPWVYTRIDALTTLRRPDMLFFTLVMPLGHVPVLGRHAGLLRL